jgi:hypothetical protein
MRIGLGWTPSLLIPVVFIFGFLIAIPYAIPYAIPLGLPVAATLQISEPVRVVPQVRDRIEQVIESRGTDHYSKVLQRLAVARQYPASLKLSLVEKTFGEPWQGMEELERIGLQAGRSGQSPQPLVGLIDTFAPLIEIENSSQPAAGLGVSESWEQQLQLIREVLGRSHRMREGALAGLTQSQREFLFQHSEKLVADFSAQTSCQSEQYDRLRADQSFFIMAARDLDWNQLTAAAGQLALLTEELWLENFAGLARQQPLWENNPSWVQGSLIWAEETEYGWIVVGGPESNTYQLDQPVAVLIEIGGDDVYQGMIGANDLQTGLSLVIDLQGDDTYQSHPLGLATGRLGVGIVLDREGTDQWKLADGSGGTGFAGLGLLQKNSGQGRFIGGRWTLGAAMAGMGLVLGGTDKDSYQADLYSIGIGGPWGIGAIIDRGGDDHYRCGFRYGSGYNRSDAPQAKPGDPDYQYEGWGLGMGLGRRFYPWLTADQQEFQLAQLAGGLGMVIDIDGNDRYESSNFSLGCGYYFGAGLKLDLAGDDRYQTARYGNGAGAHQAIGLAVDYRGSDHYESSGPTYHGGCAWDGSVFMCIAGGPGSDRYQLSRTSALGVADHGSLGVFADLGGDESYNVGSGLARGSDGSLAIFLDAAGQDDYGLQTGSPADSESSRGNGKIFSDPANSSLFIDRN